MAAPGVRYDRSLLLHGPKRNEILSLEEVEQYGQDSFGDRDYLSLHGMPPRAWHGRGLRVLGRTAVECTRDALGDAIGQDVAAAVGRLSVVAGILAIDPFAGSCNTLDWILRHLPGSEGIGFELDAQVHALTRRNLEVLERPITLYQGDYRALLGTLPVPADRALVLFVAPPWGTALDERTGLDLSRTTPPVTEVISDLSHRYPTHRLLFAVQVYEKVEPASLAEVRRLLDASDLHVYGISRAGQNHGLLVGSRGWPEAATTERE